MKILSVECSAGPVSCAVTEDGKLKGSFYLNRNMTHSETLMPMIDALLGSSGVGLSDISCFAVAAGPGSFTGVRIGISAVKGLAFPNGTPCVAVSPLEAMAYNFLGSDAVICGCMDARRSQVYNAIFKVSGNTVTRLCDDRALSVSELLCELRESYRGERVVLAGDGAELVMNAAEEENSDGLLLSAENLRYQNAIGVAFAAEMLYNNGGAVPPEELLPVYLRLSQAERELRSRSSEER